MYKKLILLLTIFAFSAKMFAAAPPAERHLTILGIPLDGSPETIIEISQTRGVVIDTTQMEKGYLLTRGSFAGYKNVEVRIYFEKGVVFGARINFPQLETWRELESSYNSLSYMLSEKYGMPYVDEEDFDGLKPKTDKDKLFKLQVGELQKETRWDLPEGSIRLTMRHQNDMNFISLYYQDDLNYKKARLSLLDDL